MNRDTQIVITCLCLAGFLFSVCTYIDENSENWMPQIQIPWQKLVSLTPNQVTVRGNIISVDPLIINNNLIWSLITNPNEYDSELIQEIDHWIPNNNKDSIIEIGAGIGVLSAYLNNKLLFNHQQVSVEPNPKLHQSLENTKNLNSQGFEIVSKAIYYGGNNTKILTMHDLRKNKIGNDDIYSLYDTKISVPATTIENLSKEMGLSENINLIMNLSGYEHEIIQRESQFIKDHVTTLISAVYTDDNDKNNPDIFSLRMSDLGFTEKERLDVINKNSDYSYVAMAFQKEDTNNDDDEEDTDTEE